MSTVLNKILLQGLDELKFKPEVGEGQERERETERDRDRQRETESLSSYTQNSCLCVFIVHLPAFPVSN